MQAGTPLIFAEREGSKTANPVCFAS